MNTPSALISIFGLGLLPIISSGQFKTNVAESLDQHNRAKIYHYENKIDSAIQCEIKAITAYDGFFNEYVLLGELYLTHKEYSKAVEAFSTAILKGEDVNKAEDLSDKLPSLNDVPVIARFVRNIDSLKVIFQGKYFDKEFSEFISELKGVDQYTRNKIDDIPKSDIEKIRKAYIDMSFADTAINLKRLLNYLDNHSFPAIYRLDDNTVGNFWVVVHHLLQYTGNADVRKLDKYILDAVYDGKYRVNNYLLSMDYRQMGKNKKQLYGCYKSKNVQGETVYIPEFEDIEHVDERRANWHLISLRESNLVDEQHPLLPKGYK